jgi:hypothetical protein
MDNNKKVVQHHAKAKVHFIESWINFLKHNEIGTGHVTNKGGGGGGAGVRHSFFLNFLTYARGICHVKSHDLENQKLFCMCNIKVYNTKILFLR